MTIKLIVTADDCGLARCIDDSTAALFHKGMVTTASLITNYPHVKDTVAALGSLPNLEMGVHLNLTEGEPLSQKALQSDLVVASGRFRNRLFLLAQSVFLASNLQRAIETELRAQIEHFIDLAGYPPAHLTTHMHFHMLPALRDIVYRLGKEYGVRWIRNSDFRASAVPLHPLLSTTLKQQEASRSFFVPDYLAAVMAYLSFPPEQMLSDLLKLNGTVEMVVHPSEPHDNHFPRHTAYFPSERNRETRYLERLFMLLEPHLGHEVELMTTVEGVRVEEN
jgi:predicted glycoside hydrolase/deacetylase ChbG (UPF0249 family)